MDHSKTTPTATESHEPHVAGPTPEEVADGRRAEKVIARVVGPVGLVLFVVAAGLLVGSFSFAWAPLWLLVAAHGLAAWRESREIRAAA